MTTETEPRIVNHQGAVAALTAYCDYRRIEGDAKRGKDEVGSEIKLWMQSHDEEELRDGEHNITARLQRRQGSPQLDAPNATTEHLRWLADHGCLKLDYTTFKNLVGKFPEALDINRTLMPGGETVALDVREGK